MSNFSKVEMMGILLEELWESCATFDESKDLRYEANEIEPDYDRWTTIRLDYQNANHSGDCLKMCFTCTACYWHDLLSQGATVGLILAREERGEIVDEWKGGMVKHFKEEYGMSQGDTTLMIERYRLEVSKIESANNPDDKELTT